MVVLAESFLQMIENTSLSIATSLPIPVKPITHKRYVDDTHDRFNSIEESESFLEILNNQDARIRFEPEYENANKELNYLDTTIINNRDGNYKFKLYRKDAITNIQIKPNSCHDGKVKIGLFKGYISRAKSICSPEYFDEEIKFLVNVFVENGYKKEMLENIVNNENKIKIRSPANQQKYVSLPFLPGICHKLRKSFKKIGCKVSFKSPNNLNAILTSSNKPKLPINSHPGVYIVPCECNYRYTGQTEKRVFNRVKQHAKNVFEENVDMSAISEHNVTCDRDIEWTKTKTLSIEPTYFRRCVREGLEIQRHKTGPNDEYGMNKDYGRYVKTETWKSLFDHKNLYA